MVLSLLLATEPSQSCVSAYGKKACGYDCKAEYSQVVCAATPQGRCITGDGKVLCFDPPAHVIQIYGDALPRPDCRQYNGQLACGYNCRAQSGSLACAATPAGVCDAPYDRVICFDPPPAVFGVYQKNVPKPECKNGGGLVACGYQCLSAGGLLRCTSTPQGICKDLGGEPVCFDPSPDVLCAHGKSLRKPECQRGTSQFDCGYKCLTVSGQVKCAQSPDGTCDGTGEGVSCFDPPIATKRLDSDASECFELLGLASATKRARPTPKPTRTP